MKEKIKKCFVLVSLVLIFLGTFYLIKNPISLKMMSYQRYESFLNVRYYTKDKNVIDSLERQVFTGLGSKELFIGEWGMINGGTEGYCRPLVPDKPYDWSRIMRIQFTGQGVAKFFLMPLKLPAYELDKLYEIKNGKLLIKDNNKTLVLKFGFLMDEATNTIKALAVRGDDCDFVLGK